MERLLRDWIQVNDGRTEMGMRSSGSELLRQIYASILVALLFLIPGASIAAEVQSPVHTLEKIEFSALPGNKVQIKLSLSGPGISNKPLSFAIENPARIALDFLETSSNVPRRQSVGVGVIRSINAVEAKGRTRIILNLDQLVPYETRVADNNVYITLEAASPVAAANVATPIFPTAIADAVVDSSTHSLKSIDFQRGVNGEGRIIVAMSDDSIPVNVNESGKRIIIDFVDASLPADLIRRMDVIDFATPVTMIDSFASDGNVRLIIETEGEFDHLAYQSGEVFTLEVKPVTDEELELARLKKPEYTGEKLSLSFQDIEVRAVLQLIADFTGMNLVTSDSVEGNVTLRLKNVPWDQAMDIILKTKGLAMRQTGNVILVAPSEEIAAREKQELESQQQVKELAPLFTDLMQVNYAKGEDIATLLKAEENSLLSERGSVTVDERTNFLLVRDTAEKLDEIRRLVTKLDIPVRQVLIESRIVIASDNFGRDLGVRFGVSGVGELSNNTFGYSSGT